jgi:hypothetical protein
MEQSFSSEADSCSATQAIPKNLRNSIVHYHAHNSLTLVLC